VKEVVAPFRNGKNMLDGHGQGSATKPARLWRWPLNDMPVCVVCEGVSCMWSSTSGTPHEIGRWNLCQEVPSGLNALDRKCVRS
jgi:hypothetical protein